MSVTVSVPATSANLGSGYDCVGLALDLWNEVTVSLADEFSMTAEGWGADELPLDKTNLVVVALELAFKAAGKKVPPLCYHLTQRIPHARGLGSSSAAIVGGLVAGLVLSGHELEVTGKEELLQLACDIEGHPDNVAPCMYGGVQLGLYDHAENRWTTERVKLHDGFMFIMFVPDFTGITEELRRVVPKQVPLHDAVFNMGRLAWMMNAFSTGRADMLRIGMQDRIHQPQRGKAVYHHLEPMIEAAYAAGAHGAYLSGAGPTVMTVISGVSAEFFTQKKGAKNAAAKVAAALLRVAKENDIKGRVFVAKPALTGAYIKFAEPPFSDDLVSYAHTERSPDSPATPGGPKRRSPSIDDAETQETF